MNPDTFSEWLRAQGHRVVRTKSCYWFDQGPRVFQSFPYHWVVTPDESELADFMEAERAIGLRYSTPIEAAEGAASYHAIYDYPEYGFSNLGKWARRNTRRGLRNCSVEPISFRVLSEDGFDLQRDTLDRQGRNVDIKKKEWSTLCRTAGELPGFEAWGAYMEDVLAASVITFQMDTWCYLLYQQCRRDFMSDYVNNALTFKVTKEMIGRPSITALLYGLHSLDAPASVDTFKFRMGYRAKPVRQRVLFHPYLTPLVSGATHSILRALLALMPGNVTLSKAEGMIRLFRQGRRPLRDQNWSKHLEKNAVLLKQIHAQEESATGA